MTHRPGGREMGGYLLLSYGTAWGIWLMCGMMPPGAVTAQLLNTVVMWTPALAVWLMWLAGRRRPVLSFSLRPALRRNWKWYLAAWALSLAAAVLGALLYFGVYPRDFDSTLPALAPMMEQAGISRSTVVSLLLGVLVYGPVINLFFAIGEEIGWRGFLYPALRQRMSTLPACLLVGAIWGLWHTPVNLMGHNYGTSYPGFPWLGILGMCLFTTSAGTFLAWLSERSGSLWPAALAHGTINAAAQVALLFRGAEGAVRQIWGPAVTGILAGMPMLVLSAVLLVRKGSWRKSR